MKKVSGLSPGTIFNYGGEKFVVLEQMEDGAFCLLAQSSESVPFHRNGGDYPNNYTSSTLRKDIEGSWLDSLIANGAKKQDLVPFDVDLRQADGSFGYGVLEGVYARMATLNKAARDAALPFRVHACTDVTGFGLLGHALELAQGGDVHLTIDTAAADIPAAALEFARMGLLPEGMYRNRRYAEPYVDAGGVPLEVQDALYDPQTSGGLLFAVHPDDADALFAALQKTVPSAQRVGTVQTYTDGARISLR